MKNHKVVVGENNKAVIIPCTAEEEVDIVNRQSTHIANAPLNQWKRDISRSDNLMPRYLEDLITDNPTFTINEYTKTKYDDKVALRATQPEA